LRNAAHLEKVENWLMVMFLKDVCTMNKIIWNFLYVFQIY